MLAATEVHLLCLPAESPLFKCGSITPIRDVSEFGVFTSLPHGTSLQGQGRSIPVEAPAAAHQDSWPGSGPSELGSSPASLLTPLNSDCWVLDEHQLSLLHPLCNSGTPCCPSSGAGVF